MNRNEDESPSVIDGRFEILSQLGEGGMGVVYRALHRGMDRHVALKLLKASYSHGGEPQLRFKKEAQVISTLDHPNIVSIYSVGVTESGAPYIAMELLDGRPLSEVIKDTAIPWRSAVPLFIQACAALEHAHSKGIIHRDIKPSNLVVLDELSLSPQVKVVDFGIAKVLSDDAITRTNVIIGSAFYLSPGQCEGRAANPQSDIYSVGCSLFEVLSGRPPFIGDFYLETIAKHRNETPPRVKEVNPRSDIPESLEAVIACCLSKDPHARYQSVSDLRDDLQRVLSDGEPKHIPTVAQAPRQKRMPSLPKQAVPFALAVVTMSAIAIAGLQMRPQSEQSKPAPVNQQQMRAQLRSQINAGKEEMDSDLDRSEQTLTAALKQAQAIDDPFETLQAAVLLDRLYVRQYQGLTKPALDALSLKQRTMLSAALEHAKHTRADMTDSERTLLWGQIFSTGSLLSLACYLGPDSLAAAEAQAEENLQVLPKAPASIYFRDQAIIDCTRAILAAVQTHNEKLAMAFLRARTQLQRQRHWQDDEIKVSLEQAARKAERSHDKGLAKRIRALPISGTGAP